MLESLIVIVLIGSALPLVGGGRGARTVCWIYLALIPLFMYDKALFAVIGIAGVAVQWPTLAKDLTGFVILAALVGADLVAEQHMLRKTHRRALVVVGIFLVYWLLTALMRGVGLSMATLGVRPYAFYTVLGLVMGAYLFREKGAVTRLATIVLAGCLVIAAVALVQRYVWPRFLIHPAMRDVWLGTPVPWEAGRRRVAAYFTSPNTLGLFMGLGILTAMWCVVEESESWRRPLAAVALPILFWVLLLTLSRTALVVTACASILLLWCMGVGRTARTIVVVSGAATVIALVLATTFSQRFVDLGDNPRLLYWGAYLLASFASPTSALLGYGVGSVGRFGAQVAGGGVVIQSLASQIGTANVYFVDNSFIQALYETGIVGCLFIVWALWLFARSYVWVYRRQAVSERVRRLSLPSTIMAYILGASVFTSSLGTYPWNLLFWTCASGFLLVWDRTSRIEVSVPRPVEART